MTSGSSTQPFVGRTEELASFERAVAGARTGLPAVVLIGGEAGIGKSTLLAEAARRTGADLHFGRCTYMGGDVIPLAPLADLLRRVGPTVRTDLPGPMAREHTFSAVLDLLAELSAEDVAVVGLEDLHWADAMTWDLVGFLARNLRHERVVLAATYRTDEVRNDPSQRRHLGELSRLPRVSRIHLGGLDRDGVSGQVEGLTGEPAPWALVEQILARGQGNPFFTEQLVAAHASGETIPLVLSDLISADVAMLDDACHQILAGVAVLGRPTPHALLASIIDVPANEIEGAVRTAIEARLLVVDRGTDAYRFRHGLIGEVVHGDLLPPQRARLHRRVADVLAGQSADVLARPDAAGELAFHLDRAGDTDVAFTALLAAADAAEGVAPGAALRHLQRALQLWDAVTEPPSDTLRAARMWQAAELASGAVSNARAAELAREAFAIAPPPPGESFGHERLGRYLWASGELAAAADQFERAASLLPPMPGVETLPVVAGLAQAALMSGQYEAAERWCDQVFHVAPEPPADPRGWVMARRVLGIVRSQSGHSEEAVRLCAEAVAAAPTVQARALASIYLGVALIDAGHFVEARDVAVDAADDARRWGLDRSFGGYLDGLSAEALLHLGRWKEADATLARHVAPDPLPVGALRIACVGARLAARRGDHDRAGALLVEAEALPADGLHQALQGLAAAEVHFGLKQWAAAAAAAERGWRAHTPATLLYSARFARLSVDAAVELALDAMARRDPVDVAGVVSGLRERIGRLQDEWESRPAAGRSTDVAAQLAHAAASLTRLTGPEPAAWGAAARQWAVLGDDWAAAVALLRQAEAAAASGDAAQASTALVEANGLATDLGAAALLADIAELSHRTRLSVEAPTVVVLDQESRGQLGLTPREAEVLALVSGGRTNRQIGQALFVSEKTVSVHVSNIMRKLGVRSRVDAAAVAQRLGLAAPARDHA